MSEQKQPTAADVFRNIAALLQGAMHPGAHAGMVAHSIAFLEELAKREDESAEAAAQGPQAGPGPQLSEVK